MTETAAERKSPFDTGPGRRPRFAVLGEFSAGKSTLINLLSNGATLKTQVTATQMAPVWLSHGGEVPHRVALSGEQHPYAPGDPVDVERTAFVRMFAENTILSLCDLIDTPGNSDPNINPIAWERMIEVADAAIWCTPATQAWRQSERASWREVPARFRRHSILLVTQADKLESPTDREKVLRRVTRDAKDEFAAIFMLSLVRQDDFEGFLRKLIGSVKALRNDLDRADGEDRALGRSELSLSADDAADAAEGAVLPRRIGRPTAPRPDGGSVRPGTPVRPTVSAARRDAHDEGRIAMLRDDFREGGAEAQSAAIRSVGNEG